MSERRSCASSQQELFARTMSPTIPVNENHHLVRLADEIDWTELRDRSGVDSSKEAEKRRWLSATPPSRCLALWCCGRLGTNPTVC